MPFGGTLFPHVKGDGLLSKQDKLSLLAGGYHMYFTYFGMSEEQRLTGIIGAINNTLSVIKDHKSEGPIGRYHIEGDVMAKSLMRDVLGRLSAYMD